MTQKTKINKIIGLRKKEYIFIEGTKATPKKKKKKGMKANKRELMKIMTLKRPQHPTHLECEARIAKLCFIGLGCSLSWQER